MTKISRLKPMAAAAILLAGITLLAACNGSSGNRSGNNADSTALSSGKDDNTLLGAGSTFVYPLFSKLFYVYHQQTGLKINY
ncbi:MAG: hypothetical protein EPN37_00605, partial [Chitinophagaceae bacterium]